MHKLHQSITINASKQRVWNAITNLSQYKIWTEAFTPGSYFEGNWQQGEKMKFLAKDKENISGLTSVISENRLFEFISIKYLGLVKNGMEDFTSEEAKKWTPCFENYTLLEKDFEITEFVVDMEVADGFEEEMEKMWQKGMLSLKEISEKPFEKISIQVSVNKPVEAVWECYTNPENIKKWNFASPNWHCPKAENDLKIGGRFSYTIAAKDESFSFDFSGTYTKIENYKLIEYILDDGRKVQTIFEEKEGKIKVITNFEAEAENSLEMQKQGWQAILDNFKKVCDEL